MPPRKRPLQDKSVSELVHMFNEKCLAARSLGSNGATEGYEDDEEMPSTFLKNPASEEAIEKLQRTVRASPHNFTNGLPEDYVEFLRITNGIYGGDDGRNAGGIFSPVETVKPEEDGATIDMLKMDLDDLNDKIDWPTESWVIDIGPGGDEGQHLVLPPSTVEQVIDGLRKARKKASKAGKEKIDDFAAEIGGLKTEYFVVRMYHWAAEIEVFSSFKHLLENFVQGMDEDLEKKGIDQVGNDDSAKKAGTAPQAPSRRRTIPEGKPSALKDLKFLFTGTLDLLDRKTAKITVEKYGGTIVSNLEKADYIVLGANCGPKKLDTIKEKNLTTISEEGFFLLLEDKQPAIETQEDLEPTSAKSMPAKSSKKGKGVAQKKENETSGSSSTAKAAGAERKTQAKGKPNALKGMKLLFTGTLETMDRNAAKKTAEAHGAKVITKLADTDSIVLGVKAGQKKLDEIEAKGLKTCSEAEFTEMLEEGGGKEEEDDGDEEEEEKAATGKKRGAAATGRGKGSKARKTG